MKNSKEMLVAYQTTAEKKTSLSIFKMILSGVFAGVFIGLGGLGSQIASTATGGAVGRLAGACVFPVGLFLVVTIGVELFTGNCLLVIPWFSGMINKNNTIKISSILKNWLFVYIGNFIGSLILAIFIYFSGLGTLFDGGLTQTSVSAASAKIALSPAEAIIRGLLCNFLVCLAVWVAMMADDAIGKAIAVFAPVMLFVLCGFEHSVANMYFIPLGIMYDSSISVVEFLLNNLLPVTIGNIIGGAICVGGGLVLINKD